MAGLSVDLSQGFLPSLVAGIVLVSVVWILRPVTVALFFRGSSFLNAGEQRFLSIWAPKGAISMALAITIPDLIEKSGIPYERVINPVSEAFVIDAVCFAVVISMLLKSLILPSLHKWLVVEVSELSLEETASG
jgi:NhaP-type Na+/H+ or K+/H+ antiporter